MHAHRGLVDATLTRMPINTDRPIGAGPFECEPVQLGRLLSEGFSNEIDGTEIHRRSIAWFADHLLDADVTLGSADREIVEVIADEGWSVVQVVAGWVTRAHEQSTT